MGNSVIVCGLGRCGTTMVYNTLLQKYETGGFLKTLTDDVFLNNHAYKSHWKPSNRVRAPEKVIYIFMYGNPYHIVRSSHGGRVDLRVHYGNLDSNFSENKQWREKDTLHLERLFDTWNGYVNENKHDVIFLRYESMYNNLDKLQNDLGVSLNFPKWEPRMFNGVKNDILIQTYKSLKDKIDNAPDYKLFESKI